MNRKQTVVVFGGAKGIGEWMIRYLFAKTCETIAIDIDDSRLNKLPECVIKINNSKPDSEKELEKLITPGSWVFFATPTRAVRNVAKWFFDNIGHDVLVLQCASVQRKGEQALVDIIPSNCSYMGFHPLFGPNVTSPIGQTVAITFPDSTKSIHKNFRKYLETKGLILTVSTSEEHDKAMLTIQTLTHFTLLSFAKSLALSGLSLTELSKFKTPPFQFITAFAGRLLRGAPDTVTSIQTASNAGDMRELFINSAQEIHQQFSKHGVDTESLNRYFESIRAPYSGNEIEEAVSVSNAAVEAMQRFEAKLHGYKASRNACFAKHRDIRDPTRFIIGYIESINGDEVLIREGIVRPKGRKNEFAIAFNETAEKNYRKLGIYFPTHNMVRYKKRKIALLSKNEVDVWLRSKDLILYPHRMSFNNPLDIDGEALSEIIPGFLTDIRHCNYIDTYKRKGEVARITLDLQIAPWVDVAETCNKVQKFLIRA